MPTKIHRQNKIQENRTIYVSWHVGDPTSQPWVEEFWLKITLQEPPHPPTLRRTDEALAGDRLNDTVDQILAGVTDIVAVVTGGYIKANKEGKCATDRECARFIELMNDDVEDVMRAWLAPLQQFHPEWNKIGGKPLKGFKWLKDPRFALPPNDAEIYQAVIDLLSLK